MSQYVVEQRRVAYKGRDFHFVSYEGETNKATKETGPPMWFLMSAGKRWQVCEQVRGQPVEEIDARLMGWLDTHIFG